MCLRMDRLTVSRRSNFFSMIVCLVTIKSVMILGDKLSPDLKAPLYAQGAGGLRLDPPFEGPVKIYGSITKEKNIPNFGNGEYSFNFETEDGVQREEVGKLKMVDGQLVTVVKGRYSYTSPEGLAIDVKYSADENGARSSFTFGTDPGKWKQSLLLPGGNGKSLNYGEETDRGYLPPSKSKKLENEYLPVKKMNNDYLPPSKR